MFLENAAVCWSGCLRHAVVQIDTHGTFSQDAGPLTTPLLFDLAFGQGGWKSAFEHCPFDCLGGVTLLLFDLADRILERWV